MRETASVGALFHKPVPPARRFMLAGFSWLTSKSGIVPHEAADTIRSGRVMYPDWLMTPDSGGIRTIRGEA